MLKTLFITIKNIFRPLLGKLEEKAVTTTVTPDNATYPRFTSYNKFITIKDLYENVDYRGGIYVKGKSFIGQGSVDFLAQIHFKREGKTVISTKSTSFLLKENVIESVLCNTTVYLKKDSIYHSAIHLRYSVPKRSMANRGETVRNVCLL